MNLIILIVILIIAILLVVIYWFVKNGKTDKPHPSQKYEDESRDTEKPRVELQPEHIETLAAYVKAQKEQAEAEQRLKDLKKAEQKAKLEVFKQTKDQLKDKLAEQLDEKNWKPLEAILKSADKGGMGIYVIYNSTKDKYYVGQAKQLFNRVRKHFAVEDMARDFMCGDSLSVKILTANELDDDYRLDHIEKTAIEIFNSDSKGYNKTKGNL